MPETNEILKIEIKESGAANAAKNLDKLEVSLGKISTTLAGLKNVDSMTKLVNSLAGLNNIKIPKSVSNGISNIASALNGIDYSSAGVQGLTDDLTKLGQVDYSNLGSKMSASFGKGIGSIATALNGLTYASGNIDEFIADLEKLGSSLRGFSAVAGVDFSGIGKVTESMTKLGNLKTIDSKKLEQNMVAIANAVKRLDRELDGIDAARMRELAAAARAVAPAMKNASVSTKDLNKSLRLVNFDILLRWTRTAMRGFASLTKQTMELEQAMTAYNQLMGQFAVQEYEFTKTVSDRMGINPKEWMDAQSAMMTLATGFGIAADKAAVMSRNATQLGYDITALRNLPDVAMGLQAVQSGLAGEIEPLRRIGVDLSVAAMQEYAIANGIDKKVASMTQAEKALLRYNMMIQNTVSLQGQWGLELNTSQGQMRLFQNQLRMLAQEFGAVLIPILNAVLPMLIALTKILREFVSTLAATFGNKFEWPEMDYDSSFSVAAQEAGEIEDSMAGGAASAKEMMKYLAGFDDLNVMNLPKDAAGAGGAGVGGGVSFDLPLQEYDFFKQINEMTDEWMNRLEPVRKILNLIAEHAKEILIAIGAIAAGIAAWKLLKFLAELKNVLATLAGIQAAAKALRFIPIAIGLTMTGLSLAAFIDSIVDAFRDGITWSNLGQFIGSAIMSGILAKLTSRALMNAGLFKAARNLNIAVGVTLALGGLAYAIANIRDMILNGVDAENIGAALGTGLVTAFGLKLAKLPTKIAGIAGLAITSTQLLIAGLEGTFTKSTFDAGDAVLNSLGFAGIGAVIGSVIPGVGTALGALVGLLAGGWVTLWDTIDDNWYDVQKTLNDISMDLFGIGFKQVGQYIDGILKALGPFGSLIRVALTPIRAMFMGHGENVNKDADKNMKDMNTIVNDNMKEIDRLTAEALGKVQGTNAESWLGIRNDTESELSAMTGYSSEQWNQMYNDAVGSTSNMRIDVIKELDALNNETLIKWEDIATTAGWQARFMKDKVVEEITGENGIAAAVGNEWNQIQWYLEQIGAGINSEKGKLNQQMAVFGDDIALTMARHMEMQAAKARKAAEEMGRNIGQGTANGVKQTAPLMADATMSGFRETQDRMGVSSPSTVARDELGYWLGAGTGIGFADGIHDYIPEGVSALGDMADEISDGFEVPDTGIEMDFDVSDLTPMTEQFASMMASWESIWNESWARMSANAMIQLAQMEFNPGILETQLPTVDVAGISASMSGEHMGNEALIEAINQSSLNRDLMIADLIETVENQNDGIIEMDGRSMGRWLRGQINDSTARAGKTIIRT